MSVNLKDQINRDILTALKKSDNDIVLALRFLMSVVKNRELEKRNKLSKEEKSVEELAKLSELGDEEVINVILGEIKKRKESIVQYEKGGREELAKKEMAELGILKRYVPEEMGEIELRAVVKKKISEMGLSAQAGGATVKEFGKIMGLIMSDVKGRASGDAVKKIIEEELKTINVRVANRRVEEI